MKILSRYQFAKSEYSREGFVLNEIEGTFDGTLRFAVWGNKSNAIAYVDLDDGRKVIGIGFQNPDWYLGIDKIEFGSRVKLTYEKGKRGNIRLKEIQRI